LREETPQRKWQRILAEYALARTEHQLACFVLTNRPESGGLEGLHSSESVAEQTARQKLLDLYDQMTLLEAASWLDAPGAIAD
jgi:hypothetical protein